MSAPTTSAFVLLLTVVMAAVTLLLAWRARRRLAGSTRAPGRIRRFTEKEFHTQRDDGAPDTDIQYFPEVEFALPDGTPVVFQSRFGDESEGRLGTQVTVVYDASSPATTAEIAGLPAVVHAWRLVLVSAAVTLGLLLFYLDRR